MVLSLALVSRIKIRVEFRLINMYFMSWDFNKVVERLAEKNNFLKKITMIFFFVSSKRLFCNIVWS